MATELTVMMPYAADQQDDEKAASWRLPSVPAALQKELDDYAAFRTSPLNRQRDGTACIDITVGNDQATTLRFMGWMLAVKDVQPGLGVFCRATLSEWVEDWLNALSEKGLKFSTLANVRRLVSSLLAGHLRRA
jgi:hypothetical protein